MFNNELALEYYYTQNELTTNDIARIFGCSKSVALIKKKEIQQKAIEEGIRPVVFDYRNVNVEYAFKVWGITEKELESKFKKLQKFRKLKGA